MNSGNPDTNCKNLVTSLSAKYGGGQAKKIRSQTPCTLRMYDSTKSTRRCNHKNTAFVSTISLICTYNLINLVLKKVQNT